MSANNLISSHNRIVYDKDAGNYYIDHQNPDNWAASKETFDTEEEAIEAARTGKFTLEQ